MDSRTTVLPQDSKNSEKQSRRNSTATDPGDEALVPDPAWFHYATLIRLCGAKPVGMPVEFKDNASSLDLEETERRLTDRTKVLIIIATSMIMGFVSVSCTHSKTIGYQKPR